MDRSPWRPFVAALLLAACAPSLDTACKSDDDCPSGQLCRASTCVTETAQDAAAGGDQPPAGGDVVPDGQSGPGGADAGRPDARPPGDAASDGPPFPADDQGKPQPFDGAPDTSPPTDAGPEADASRPGDALPPDAGPEPDAAPDTDGPGPEPDVPVMADAGPPPDAAPLCPEGVRGPIPGRIETCDGLDEDCDGHVDNDPADPRFALVQSCYPAAPATLYVGVCTDGFQECGLGMWGECREAVLPSAEVCNGLDDDCNGRVDDGPNGAQLIASCYDGLDGTLGEDRPCRAGRRRCQNGSLGACDGQVLPSVEICDGVDNDCDGAMDDVDGGCDECVPGDSRICYSGDEGTLGVGACSVGQQVCGENMQWGPCEGQVLPTSESCNGVDDDCNGETDEGIEGEGADCGIGVGTCRTVGALVCNPVAGDLVCDALPLVPAEERCNGLDDDCDGFTDEELGLGDPCQVGIGACLRNDLVICDGAGGVTCGTSAGLPGTETCNGRDDDCDGAVDEDERGNALTESCYTGLPAETAGVGLCRRGTSTCSGGLLGPCLGEVVPASEICDAADNDCDGQRDEGLGGACQCQPGDEQACYTGPPDTAGVGVCLVGEQVCGAGNQFGACQMQVLPGNEVCNNLDDDCDGRIDDVPGVGDECEVGAGQCKREGERVCRNNTLTCDVLPGQPVAERCDGLDNDCDGQIDEGFNLGAGCIVGVGECRRQGINVCNEAGAVVCNAQPGMALQEVCNGRDDDCDGVTDAADDSMTRCQLVHASEAACVAGECQVSTCAAGYYNINGFHVDGCERGCGVALPEGVVLGRHQRQPTSLGVQMDTVRQIAAWALPNDTDAGEAPSIWVSYGNQPTGAPITLGGSDPALELQPQTGPARAYAGGLKNFGALNQPPEPFIVDFHNAVANAFEAPLIGPNVTTSYGQGTTRFVGQNQPWTFVQFQLAEYGLPGAQTPRMKAEWFTEGGPRSTGFVGQDSDFVTPNRGFDRALSGNVGVGAFSLTDRVGYVAARITPNSTLGLRLAIVNPAQEANVQGMTTHDNLTRDGNTVTAVLGSVVATSTGSRVLAAFLARTNAQGGDSLRLVVAGANVQNRAAPAFDSVRHLSGVVGDVSLVGLPQGYFGLFYRGSNGFYFLPLDQSGNTLGNPTPLFTNAPAGSIRLLRTATSPNGGYGAWVREVNADSYEVRGSTITCE